MEPCFNHQNVAFFTPLKVDFSYKKPDAAERVWLHNDRLFLGRNLSLRGVSNWRMFMSKQW